MRRPAGIDEGPGVWRLRLEVARLRFSIWRAGRQQGAAVFATLADAHRRLAKEYGSLAGHGYVFAARRRAARLARLAAAHAREARRYGRLTRLAREGGGQLGRPRGLPPPGPAHMPAVPRPRGPRAPVLRGGAAAEILEYTRVRAVASSAGGRGDD